MSTTWTKTFPALLCAVVVACGETGNTGGEVIQEGVAEDSLGPEFAQESVPAAVQAQRIEAVMEEWRITLSQDTVSPGPVMFTITNSGSFRHSFEVRGAGQEWRVEDLTPETGETLLAELSPGTYEILCPVEDERGDHSAHGLRTTLVAR